MKASETTPLYTRQLAHMVKYYIRIGVRLSQKTILSCAKNFYRDEYSADPPSNALGPAWFHRFIVFIQRIFVSITHSHEGLKFLLKIKLMPSLPTEY